MSKEANYYEKELTEQFVGLNKEQQILFFYRNLIKRRKLRDLYNSKGTNANELSRMLYNDDFEYISAFSSKVGLKEAAKAMLLYATDKTKDTVKEIYADSLIHYQQILENYHQLGKELKLGNALHLSHLFSYLLWNGYLSVTKQHSYQLKDRLLLPEMPFDVINGQGVCLAYSEFLNNFLETCHKKSAFLTCKVPKNNVVNYRPEIKRVNGSDSASKNRQKIISFIFGGFINRFGNHAVVLIEDEDKIYIYDPTNLCVLNVLDKDTATLINGQGNYFIKPFSTLQMRPNADENCIFEKVVSNELTLAFTASEVIDSYEQTLDLIRDNVPLLEDAYTSIYGDLKFISNQTKELGNYYNCLKKVRKLGKNK